jgi:hypothetical protein
MRCDAMRCDAMRCDAMRGGRCPRLISSVICLTCCEIEAQLIVSMLVLDTAADAIVSRAGNHRST